jgi:ABC-type Fe3+ transport system permease subunit
MAGGQGTAVAPTAATRDTPSVAKPPDATSRETTRWTQPLQAGVAAFFVVSALVNGFIAVAFGPLYRHYYTRLYEASGVPADQVAARVDTSVTTWMAINLLLAAVFLALAALSYFRRSRWVYVIDMIVLLLAGAPSLVIAVSTALSRSQDSLPPVFGLTQLVLSLVALSLFLLMSGVSLRFGFWAQRRAQPAG